MSAKEPYNYFLLLRALFRSIGGGSHDLLYQEFLPLLPSLLQGDIHTHTHTSFCVNIIFLSFSSCYMNIPSCAATFKYVCIPVDHLCMSLSPLSVYMNSSKTTKQIFMKFGISSLNNICCPFNFHQNLLRILDTCRDNLQAFVHPS